MCMADKSSAYNMQKRHDRKSSLNALQSMPSSVLCPKNRLELQFSPFAEKDPNRDECRKDRPEDLVHTFSSFQKL